MLLVYVTVNLHSRLDMCDGLYVFALNESLFHLALIEKRLNPHVLESVLCPPLIHNIARHLVVGVGDLGEGLVEYFKRLHNHN